MKGTVSSSSVLGVICVLLGVAISTGFAAEFASELLMDFSDASAARQWTSVNDDVMGGVSEGSFRLTDDKTLLFYGRLSLENRGGFASIRTRPSDLNLDGYDTIALRIKGDGRVYYFNLGTSASRTAGSYRAAVSTQRDTWQEVRVPLKDFYYSAYGRRIAGAEPLRAREIQSVGFTLADKQAGPFRLEVDWIKAEKVGSAVASTAGGPPEDSAENRDIVDTVVAAGQFETLKGSGPFTVFAPTEEAFANLPAGTLDSLLKPENKKKLAAVLTYHVVAGKATAADLVTTQAAKTVQGQPLVVSPTVNGARVIYAEIPCTNGVIHVIDAVVLPKAPPGQ